MHALPHRQFDAKHGSAARGRRCRNRAAVLFDDPVRERETEADPLTDFLRREEGFEDPR